jgi:hypothetical protein
MPQKIKGSPIDLAVYPRSLRSDLDGVLKLVMAFERGTLQAGTRRPSGEWEDVTQQTVQLYKRMIVTYEASLAAVEERIKRAN